MNQHSTILIAEDEDLMRGILAELLTAAGYRVLQAASGEQALELFAAESPALTISDIALGKMDGIELLDRIKQLEPEALMIMITAFSSVETAIAALRKGAYDYITKPFINEDILQTARNALRQSELFRENRYLRRELKQKYNFEKIIGRSDALTEVFKLIEKIANTSSSVLIHGESGTGKELIARAIHYNSNRADGPFVAINCSALPENLLESELFGYVKGAFTGAHANKMGLLKAADGGTLFLDEIGDMPFSLQVKLLRVLQEREVMPLEQPNRCLLMHELFPQPTAILKRKSPHIGFVTISFTALAFLVSPCHRCANVVRTSHCSRVFLWRSTRRS